MHLDVIILIHNIHYLTRNVHHLSAYFGSLNY